MTSSSWRTAAAVAGVMAVLGLAEHGAAQDDENTCQEMCYEDDDLCYQACDNAGDPNACEVGCEEQLDACLERCE